MRHLSAAIALILVAAWSQAALSQHEHSAPAQQEKDKQPDGAEKRPLPLCPVMGDPVDFGVSTQTADGPVYFCCPACIRKFEKDPAKYADKVAAQREALQKLERIQVTCPVTGNPIDGKTFIMSAGQGVHFCCDKCPAKYERDPAKYQVKLAASYTYQTRCPVSGGKIDPKAFVDLAGQRVYLCCPGCAEKLTQDPAKYAPKLEAQGIRLDLKKLKATADDKKAREKPAAGHEHHDHP